ncbi:MAG: hypothetical protein IKI75_08195 [Lachnospiraceae bacterium]|nr:hypothetical protein [Lachnospiraceae bacterium]
MNLYESTVNMMSTLPESDILIIKEFISRLSSKKEYRRELYNPYKPLTREEILEQLAIARKHAEDGRIIDAHEASANIREKYGL